MNGNTEIINYNQSSIEASKASKKAKKLLIIESDDECEFEDKEVIFVKQDIRKNILENILLNKNLKGEELHNLIITDNYSSPSDSRKGDIFETECEILTMLKCIPSLNFTHILSGDLSGLKKVTNSKSILSNKIHQGDNVSDITLSHNETTIAFSVKYKKKVSKKGTDINDLDSQLKQNTDNYKIGLFVKDKKKISGSKKEDIHKKIFDKIIEDNLLFDEKDIIKAMDIFRMKFHDITLDIDDFIENIINKDYLCSPRETLILKIHQKLTNINFENSILKNKKKMWCIAHKPRSGKSITILSISKLLFKNGYKKILIMTSVPATINSFVNDLEKYIEFKNIVYRNQNEFESVNNDFVGITFCSTEYLKTNKIQKKEQLKKIGFEVIITDECHLGGSTDKTKKDILDVNPDIEEIRKNVKLNIFASGTSDKTIKYYGIHSDYVEEWEIEDEAYMKELSKPNISEEERNYIINYMTKRHGPEFINCFNDETLNKDYSRHPTQVLMKHSLPEGLIAKINNYNTTNGTNYGYCASSLFSQKQIINSKNEVEYTDEFEICKNADGKDLFIDYLDNIISENLNRKTIMKQIESLQSSKGSRISTKENPLLFIIYLPTHTGNNTISSLQKGLEKFIKQNKLWSKYNVEYSNSIEDTGIIKEEYNEYIKSIMNKTKKQDKRGCILLLGNKGSVGITYDDCDVTIHLDDGQNLDNIRQRMSRALTEANGKTIGINVDMNIQRTYLYLIDTIQKHRKNVKTTKSNAEILYYLFEHNIFLFNPQEINNGKLNTVEIISYYKKEAENIMNNSILPLVDSLLNSVVCDDDMKDFIKIDFQKKLKKPFNDDLEGDQQDCPKGDKTKTQINSPDMSDEYNDKTPDNLSDIEITKIDSLINQTYEMCKGFLFPLLALISKSYKIFDFKEIFTNIKTGRLIISLLKDKKIELNKENYSIIINNIMNKIIDNNTEIIDNIREIYNIAPAHKLRELIEKHFIPTNDEKKQNAEVPTPVKLVDEMLNLVPLEFWKTPQKVFEPCCGKGNFVLGIFDRFYKGLEEMYPDEIERCHIIMTECIYYADLTALNVFITTEIMKCHVQSYCGLDEIDYDFNNYIGNTLELNIKDKWNIIGFNKIGGNPPYNSSGDTSTGNTIWQDFTKKSLNEWLMPNGYLLFVHPPGWRKPNTERGKFTKMFDLMTKQNQMLYLEIHGIKDGQKVFNCGTRYDWYLIEKTNQYKNTIIVDEDGKQNEINLSELSWVPNSNILEINKILAKNDGERCPIMYDRTAYGADKKDRVSSKETQEFKYPCVHSTPKAGIRYMYSKVNDRGHFGVSKVIFGESGIYKPVIDMEGKYGMTHGAMAIKVDNLEEATNISKVIESDKFDKIIQSCIFSSFRIDWNIFKEFKKDFWKEFI